MRPITTNRVPGPFIAASPRPYALLIRSLLHSNLPSSVSSGRVLIVDDEYSVRRALHITLYDQGFDVSEAPPARKHWRLPA